MSSAKQTKQKQPVSASAIVRIVIWSIVLVILLSVFGVLLAGRTIYSVLSPGLNLGGYTYDDVDEYTVGGGKSTQHIRELDIDWLEGGIEILPSDDDTIIICDSYTGDDDRQRLRWKIDEGELSIKYCAPYWFFSPTNVKRKDLTVYIPRTMLDSMDEVSLESVDSWMTFTGNARELSVDGVSCELTVTGDIGELEMDAVEGKLTFYGTANEIHVNGVEGTAILYPENALRVDIDGIESEVTVYLADSIGGFRIDADSLGGEVIIDGFDGADRNSEHITTWGNGALRVNMDGLSSSVTIKPRSAAPAEVVPETRPETTPETVPETNVETAADTEPETAT